MRWTDWKQKIATALLTAFQAAAAPSLSFVVNPARLDTTRNSLPGTTLCSAPAALLKSVESKEHLLSTGETDTNKA